MPSRALIGRNCKIQAMILEKLPKLAQKRIILASASPRRQELLKQIGLKYQVIVSSFEENLSKESVSGSEYAQLTATHKALDVAQKLAEPADVVISADTVVECGGHILEKPLDEADAIRMLQLLSGRSHEVHTGVALATPSSSSTSSISGDWDVHSFVATTAVTFDDLSLGEITAYVRSGEPFGKAGSYGIQGMAAPFVQSIQGCYFNVMGLPLHRLSKELIYLIDSGKLVL